MPVILPKIFSLYIRSPYHSCSKTRTFRASIHTSLPHFAVCLNEGRKGLILHEDIVSLLETWYVISLVCCWQQRQENIVLCCSLPSRKLRFIFSGLLTLFPRVGRQTSSICAFRIFTHYPLHLQPVPAPRRHHCPRINKTPPT